MKKDEDDGDLLSNLLGSLTKDDKDDKKDDKKDTSPTVVSKSSDLVVSLAPDSPKAATIPGNISGLPVAKYLLTAGSEDVTITSLTVKRRGLSDDKTLRSLAVFTKEGRASKSKNDSQANNTEAQLNLSK